MVTLCAVITGVIDCRTTGRFPYGGWADD